MGKVDFRPSEFVCSEEDYYLAELCMLNKEQNLLPITSSIEKIIKGVKFLCRELMIEPVGDNLLEKLYFGLKESDNFEYNGIAHRVNKILGFEDLGDLNIINKMMSNLILIQKIDLNGNIIEVYNNNYKLINGYNRDELIGENTSIFKSGFQDKNFYKDVWSRLLSGNIWKGNMYNKRKDGLIYCVKKIIYPIKDNNGNIIEFIELSVDITEEDRNINTDSLTNLTNRGRFDKLLKYELRNRDHFSLLFFDIDHFKEVNDTFGHLSGDLVLKEVAKAIKDKIKNNDIFARYGGEEFIIILPNTNIKGGEAFSERIRKLVEGLKIIDNEGEEIKITISIGVAEKEEGDNENSLLKRADNALYKAKNGGRNKVVSIG